MEILIIFKYLSVAIFSMLVLLTIFGKTRDGYFLGAIISLVINFWIRIKLAENPNILPYCVALAIYIIAIIFAIIMNRWQKDKKILPLDPRYPEEG